MTSRLLNTISSLSFPNLLAQAEYPTQPQGGGIAALIGGIIWLAVMAFIIAGMWKAFVKAGKPGWASIIPIYNVIVMLEISGKPIWWIVLLLIPLVNIVVLLLVLIAFAKSYGKSTGYGIGCFFLGFIFMPLLGFGDAKYIGPQP